MEKDSLALKSHVVVIQIIILFLKNIYIYI